MSINDKDLTKDLTEEEYRIKYLKYKEKYIALKNQSAGASAMDCNSVWKDAGWSMPPCTLCANSKNLISKCCIGYRSAKKQLGKKSINFGKQMFKSGQASKSRFDELCKCGHWASAHEPLATRTFAQFGYQRVEGILNNQKDQDSRTIGLPTQIFTDLKMKELGQTLIEEFNNLDMPSLLNNLGNQSSSQSSYSQPKSVSSQSALEYRTDEYGNPL